MQIRKAHLSNLHFGRNFDLAAWKAVKTEVEAFRPNLLVVSGGIVDDPVPILQLAAKCELRQVAASAKAELVVVLENNDVCNAELYHHLQSRR